MIDKKIAIAIGRFQPPTKGHQLMYKKMLQLDVDQRKIYTTKSHDSKKNPLQPNVKLRFLKKMFPKVDVDFAINVIDALKKNTDYKQLIFIAGQDRVPQYQKLINSYNHKEYDFESIKVINVGTRQNTISATKMRNWALQGQYDEFQKNCSSALTQKQKQQLFDLVKDGLSKTNIKKTFKQSLKEALDGYMNKQIVKQFQKCVQECGLGSLISQKNTNDCCQVICNVPNQFNIAHYCETIEATDCLQEKQSKKLKDIFARFAGIIGISYDKCDLGNCDKDDEKASVDFSGEDGQSLGSIELSEQNKMCIRIKKK